MFVLILGREAGWQTQLSVVGKVSATLSVTLAAHITAY